MREARYLLGEGQKIGAEWKRPAVPEEVDFVFHDAMDVETVHRDNSVRRIVAVSVCRFVHGLCSPRVEVRLHGASGFVAAGSEGKLQAVIGDGGAVFRHCWLHGWG